MKFLFVSYDALITDIAWQVVKEGHDVRYWIREKKAKSVGEGFVPMSKDWKVFRIEVTSKKKRIGESIGMVTFQNRFSDPAPSTFAAS